MENIRRNKGFINGIVYWMFNDCWPASSGWSFVDYCCLPKASFYSFRRCSQKIICSIEKKESYDIYVCNDDTSSKTVNYKLYYLFDGQFTDICTDSAYIDAHISKKVTTIPKNNIPENAVIFCDIECNGFTDRAFYKQGNLFIKPTNAVKITQKTENSVTVYARQTMLTP
ncbi:MAG: hypothetical protein U0M42_04825 [Acutalibacteraceae bacterium]|nr:hypothetical protein [Acutalibacteraceae bacterium]